MKTRRLGLGVLLCVAMLAGTVSADFVDTFDANIDNWSVASGPATALWQSTYVYDGGTINSGCLQINNSGTGGYTRTYVSSQPFDIYTDMQSGNIRFQVDLAPKGAGYTPRLGIRLHWDDNNYFEMLYGPETGSAGSIYFLGKQNGVTFGSVAVAHADWMRTNMQMWIQIDSTGLIQRLAKPVAGGFVTHSGVANSLDYANLGNATFQLIIDEPGTFGNAVFDNVIVTGSSPIPEPATMSLLGLGGILALVRRRR